MKATSHKTIQWLVLVWFTLWMGVIMPGHTRGIVRLPGMDEAQSRATCCCDDGTGACTPDGSTADAETEDDTPTDPAKCCAVCYFNATLNTPPPITLYSPYLVQLDEIAYLARAAQTPHERISPDLYRGRPPPSA